MLDVILVVMLSGDVRNVSGQAVTTPSMLISMSAAALNDATIGLCAALGMQMHTMLHLRDTTSRCRHPGGTGLHNGRRGPAHGTFGTLRCTKRNGVLLPTRPAERTLT